MRKFFIILVCASVFGPVSAAQRDSLDRGFAGNRMYLDLMWMWTVYRAPKVTEQGYPGVTFKPDIGFDAGVGMVIPLHIRRSGRYYHLSTHVCYGVTPIRIHYDYAREDFRTSMDHSDVLNTNTMNIAVRQGFYTYSRVRENKVNRYGLVFGVRASEHLVTEFGYRNPESEIELQSQITYTGNSTPNNWTGALDIQFVRGWQWLSRNGAAVGIDLVLSLSAGEKPEYQYRVFSDFYESTGTFVQRTNFIGIRFSAGFTGIGKHHTTGVRFPG